VPCLGHGLVSSITQIGAAIKTWQQRMMAPTVAGDSARPRNCLSVSSFCGWGGFMVSHGLARGPQARKTLYRSLRKGWMLHCTDNNGTQAAETTAALQYASVPN
jgi:hypothetical protein